MRKFEIKAAWENKNTNRYDKEVEKQEIVNVLTFQNGEIRICRVCKLLVGKWVAKTFGKRLQCR